MNFRHRLIGATPFLCIIAYFTLGYTYDLWGKAWIVFLLIPLMPIILGIKKFRMSFSMFILVIYLMTGFIWSLWGQTWILFFLIPVYHIMSAPKSGRRIYVNMGHSHQDTREEILQKLEDGEISVSEAEERLNHLERDHY